MSEQNCMTENVCIYIMLNPSHFNYIPCFKYIYRTIYDIMRPSASKPQTDISLTKHQMKVGTIATNDLQADSRSQEKYFHPKKPGKLFKQNFFTKKAGKMFRTLEGHSGTRTVSTDRNSLIPLQAFKQSIS